MLKSFPWNCSIHSSTLKVSLVTISWMLHFPMVKSRTDGQRERGRHARGCSYPSRKVPSHRQFLKAEPNVTHNGLTWKENSSNVGDVEAAPAMLPWINQLQILLHPHMFLCLNYIPELDWRTSGGTICALFFHVKTVLNKPDPSQCIFPDIINQLKENFDLCGCGLFVL